MGPQDIDRVQGSTAEARTAHAGGKEYRVLYPAHAQQLARTKPRSLIRAYGAGRYRHELLVRDNIMTEIEIKEQVDVFMALPRVERRAKFFALPQEVQAAARAASEARRGIVKRENGKIVHSKEAYIGHILRMHRKGEDLRKRLEKVPKRIEALKAALSANYGEEALKEAEAALGAAGNE